MKNPFKLFRYVCAAILSIFTVAACSDGGGGEEPKPEAPVLSAMPTSFVKGGSTTFTVRLDGEDITPLATIVNKTDGITLDGATWSSDTEGSFKFEAAYNGQTSNEVTIKVADQAPGDTFYRYVLLTKFTGAKCSACAGANATFNQMTDEQKEHFVVMGLYEYPGDPLTTADGKQLASFYNVQLFPTWFFNFIERKNGVSEGGISGSTVISNQIGNSQRSYPTVCGIIASSTVSGSTASIEAKVKFQEEGNYKIGCVLTQKVTVGNDVFGDVYRKRATEMLGDAITPAVTGEDERTFNFDITLDGSNNADDCNFVLYVFKEEGNGEFVVNNALLCPVGGAVTEYRYAE